MFQSPKVPYTEEQTSFYSSELGENAEISLTEERDAQILVRQVSHTTCLI